MSRLTRLAACLPVLAFAVSSPTWADPTDPAHVMAQRFATDTEKSDESEILKRAREEKLQREADEKAVAARKLALDKKKIEDEAVAKKLADEKAVEERKRQAIVAAEKAEADRLAAAKAAEDKKIADEKQAADEKKAAEEKRLAEQKAEQERIAADQLQRDVREAEEWKAAQIKERQQREATERAATDAKADEDKQKKASLDRQAEQDRIAEKLKRAREQRLDQVRAAETPKIAPKQRDAFPEPKAEAKTQPKPEPRLEPKAEPRQQAETAGRDRPNGQKDWAYGPRRPAPLNDGGMALGRPPHEPRSGERWQRDDDDDDDDAVADDDADVAANSAGRDSDKSFVDDDVDDTFDEGRNRQARGSHVGDLDNVTVLLVMKPGHRGIRRLNQVADPVLCVGVTCYISTGAEAPARAVPRMAALGPFNTFGMRAGACRRSLTCVFRGIDLTQSDPRGYSTALQPVDMHFLRHDRRTPVAVTEDSNCRARPGRLACARKIEGDSWTAWVVPEEIAREAGTGALLAALKRGLSSGRSAALGK